MSTHNPEKFITVAAAAKQLNVSDSHIYTLCDCGKIKHYRFGKSYRIKTKDLDQYMRKCAVEIQIMEE